MNQCPICGADLPEGQIFCSNCGISLVQIESEQEPVSPPVVKRSKAPFIIAVIIAVAAVIATGWSFYLYLDTSEDLSTARSQLYRDRNELSKAQNELSEAQGKLSETQSELSEVQNELSEAQDKLSETQSELSAILGELSETQSEMAAILGELSETRSELDKLDDLIGVYGYGSKDFYAQKSVVLLRKSEKKYVTIYANLSGTVSWHNSNSGVKCEWSREWSLHETQIIFTGNSAGYYAVQFTNSVNNDSFEILVIVTD